MSEADVGGMAGEAEPFCQYSFMPCCHVANGRGTAWQKGIWQGSAYEAKVCHWIHPCRKVQKELHTLTFMDAYWTERQWMVSFSSGNSGLHVVAVWQMAEEGQSDTTVSDVEEHMKQRYATKLLHVKKMVPTGIHQCLQIICGDQTVNASTVRWWVMHFSSTGADFWAQHTCSCLLLGKMHS